MFSHACSLAAKFTIPLIISSRQYNKKCAAGLGACVVINEEGWFITAYHIIEQFIKMNQQIGEYNKTVAERSQIENNTALKQSEKHRKLGAIKVPTNIITNASLIGGAGLVVDKTFHILPDADLAVGKFMNFNATSIKDYPKFKNPSEPMRQGTSLCKMGFPFHGIQPSFDEDKRAFVLPPETFPVPIFPLDGIFTRTINVNPNTPSKHPVQYIETSSPGLRGQSGGPTFDIHGAIWALQSRTNHLKLGFGDNQKTSKETEHLQNQYMNVGWGTHVKTITSLLTEKNVKFDYYNQL